MEVCNLIIKVITIKGKKEEGTQQAILQLIICRRNREEDLEEDSIEDEEDAHPSGLNYDSSSANTVFFSLARRATPLETT